MKIGLAEQPPVKRTFTLVLDEDELAVVAHALTEDSSDIKRGEANNYDIFEQVGSVMDEHNIASIEDDD